MVFFAVSLPIILLFVSFVVDVGNWWEHKRHLQMQADAAALAGASQMSMPCDNEAVHAEILRYAGIDGSQYNAQIGGTPAERLHMAVNSKTWPLQSSPIDPTVVVGEPCQAAMVDVKLTETDVPWFFKIAPALGIDGADFVNARARASFVKIDSLAGAMPIGVPDINPRRAKVQFINEDDPARPVLGEAELTRIGTFNGLAKWELPATSAVPVTVTETVKNIGVRVVVSGAGSLTCGERFVDCYDAGSSNGLLRLRGWTAGSATGNAPVAKSIGLRATNCVEAYFNFSSTPCSTGLSAEVDFGPDDPVSVGAKVRAVAGGQTYNAEYIPGSCEPTDPPEPCPGRWELPSTQLIPVAPDAGAVPVELRWEQTQGTRGGQACTADADNPCKGSFGTVQRAFAGSDPRSGPLRIVKLYESGLPLQDHSLACDPADPPSCTHNLTVEVGLLGAFEDAKSVDSPLIGLRVTGGSQNQSLDCGESLPNLKSEIIGGCAEGYKLNEGTPCPTQIATLWASPQPWPCVAVQTGGAVGQVSAGMNARVLGSEKPKTCTAPNRWYEDYPDFQEGDPRIVDVFLTPYGTFSGSGNTTVPVINFATFYVSGWIGNPGFKNPCTGIENEVIGEGEEGYIYGRFVKVTRALNNATGNTPCDFESFGACTAVLTE